MTESKGCEVDEDGSRANSSCADGDIIRYGLRVSCYIIRDTHRSPRSSTNSRHAPRLVISSRLSALNPIPRSFVKRLCVLSLVEFELSYRLSTSSSFRVYAPEYKRYTSRSKAFKCSDRPTSRFMADMKSTVEINQ